MFRLRICVGKIEHYYEQDLLYIKLSRLISVFDTVQTV